MADKSMVDYWHSCAADSRTICGIKDDRQYL